MSVSKPVLSIVPGVLLTEILEKSTDDLCDLNQKMLWVLLHHFP